MFIHHPSMFGMIGYDNVQTGGTQCAVHMGSSQPKTRKLPRIVFFCSLVIPFPYSLPSTTGSLVGATPVVVYWCGGCDWCAPSLKPTTKDAHSEQDFKLEWFIPDSSYVCLGNIVPGARERLGRTQRIVWWTAFILEHPSRSVVIHHAVMAS